MTRPSIAERFVEAGPLAGQLGTRAVLHETARHNPIVAGAMAALDAHPDRVTQEQVMLVCIMAMDAALETTTKLAVEALERQMPAIALTIRNGGA